MEIYTLKKDCRLCGAPLPQNPILSLGNQCISAFVDEETEPIEAPLDLVLCSQCNLLQLKHTTNPQLLYTDNYGYRTGLNSTMKKEMACVRDAVMAQKRLKKDDVVVDIGSSDATLLKLYPESVIKVGFEPVKKLRSYHNSKGIMCFPEFFNSDRFKRVFGEQKAKVITAIAMFYDLDDPNKFLKDITEILDDDGILVIQQNYLPKMLKEGTFDNISHEHVAYYSLTTLRKLLKQHNLEVFDVQESPINGGCFRVFARFRTEESSPDAVWKMAVHEDNLLLQTELPYKDFSQKVKENINKLRDFVDIERDKGKKFWIYGASTRGNVILQAAGLKYPLIEGASERNPEKWGKRTLGTNIPIYSEEEARIVKPDYFIILPYWFAEEFQIREREYLNSGGVFVLPLPEFRLITKGGKNV